MPLQETEAFSLLLSVCLGLSLAAACGFRVFVPFLVMGLGARANAMELASGFNWIASDAAIATFAVATVLEVSAYFIPWVDNALDAAATPVAVVAGVIASSSVLGDFNPLVQWVIAGVGGGGAAAVAQSMTVVGRGVSTLSTGGLANPAYATAEASFAGLFSTLAVALPAVAMAAVLTLIVLVVRAIVRRRRCRAEPEVVAAASPSRPATRDTTLTTHGTT